MTPYADSSFLVRLYVHVPDTAEAHATFASARLRQDHPVPLTWLHRIEVKNAFQLCVFSGVSIRQLHVTPEQAAVAHANFREDIAVGTFLRRATLDLSALEALFEDFSLRHTARDGFRTYDILHVASARLLACDSFWSFDGKANKLARLEGLRVLPN